MLLYYWKNATCFKEQKPLFNNCEAYKTSCFTFIACPTLLTTHNFSNVHKHQNGQLPNQTPSLYVLIGITKYLYQMLLIVFNQALNEWLKVLGETTEIKAGGGHLWDELEI